MLTSVTAVAASIPSMVQSFPGFKETDFELLITISSFFVVAGVLLSPLIVHFIHEKSTVILGLLLAGFGGIIPAFISNYWMILIGRAFLGLGLGLYNSLAVSLIYLFYNLPESEKMIGYQNAFQNFGAAGLTLFSGALLSINWRFSFLVYVIAIFIGLFFKRYVFIPVAKKRPKMAKTEYQVTPKACFLLFAMVFGMMIYMSLYNGISIKFSSLIVAKKLATSSQASVVLTVMLALSGAFAMTFSKLSLWLKNYLNPTSVIMLAIGYLIMTFADNFFLAGLGAIIGGMSFAIFGPYLFLKSAEIHRIPVTMSSTCLLIGANIGCFLTPFIFEMLGQLASKHIMAELTMACILICVCAITYLFITIVVNKINNKAA